MEGGREKNLALPPTLCSSIPSSSSFNSVPPLFFTVVFGCSVINACVLSPFLLLFPRLVFFKKRLFPCPKMEICGGKGTLLKKMNETSSFVATFPFSAKSLSFLSGFFSQASAYLSHVYGDKRFFSSSLWVPRSCLSCPKVLHERG